MKVKLFSDPRPQIVEKSVNAFFEQIDGIVFDVQSSTVGENFVISIFYFDEKGEEKWKR